MFTLYLAFLIFGGILLGASFINFGGGEDVSHSDGGHAGDSDFGNDIDNNLEHGSESSALEKVTTNLDHHGIAKEAAQFFSFRNFVYFSTFFGLTGTFFSLLSFSQLVTFISSLGMGTISYVFGYWLMKYLRNTESGEEVKMREIVGRKGMVGITVGKDKRGKVIIEVGSYSREYTATLSESSEADFLQPRENILVIDIAGDCLIVDKYEV
ncbi:MAG: hypothetical protein WC313_07970 [Candidatus Kapaibacterium sp.]|jgi:membrane protein implicated in regulation of membrane protease activity|nr:hypothetical protein [Candidatus Kapabacteria bacterium]